MKPLRVLVLVHADLVPPETLDDATDKEVAEWKTEFDVISTLRDMGHRVRPLGLADDLGVLRRAILDWKPHIAFNLLEEFHGVGLFDQHVVSYLELMKQRYTGCNPRGLMLTHDKPLMKKVLAYHRIATPRFATLPRNRRIIPPKRLSFPMLVKSTTEDASLGIAQASIVTNNDRLTDRVKFVHEQVKTDAIVEEYIEGRELYVGVLGNRRLQVFPTWEMMFDRKGEGAPRIATAKVKWDEKYQKKWDIRTQAAEDLPPDVEKQIPILCKRIYRVLHLTGYGRMDLRLREDGRLFVLEANANPNLSYGEDLAESAEKAGVSYDELLKRILNLGLRHTPTGIR